jgi:hypothetical protein
MQDMINSLGAYVQNVFVSLPSHEAAQQLQQLSTAPTSPTMLSGLPIGWYTVITVHKGAAATINSPHLFYYAVRDSFR